MSCPSCHSDNLTRIRKWRANINPGRLHNLNCGNVQDNRGREQWRRSRKIPMETPLAKEENSTSEDNGTKGAEVPLRIL
ncbi:hypothetical protein K0M31_008574, partial [Melipona bicolor]